MNWKEVLTCCGERSMRTALVGPHLWRIVILRHYSDRSRGQRLRVPSDTKRDVWHFFPATGKLSTWTIFFQCKMGKVKVLLSPTHTHTHTHTHTRMCLHANRNAKIGKLYCQYMHVLIFTANVRIAHSASLEVYLHHQSQSDPGKILSGSITPLHNAHTPSHTIYCADSPCYIPPHCKLMTSQHASGLHCAWWILGDTLSALQEKIIQKKNLL